MLKLVTDLLMAERLDIKSDSTAYLSGYQGSWVTLDSNGYVKLTTEAAKPAYAIWNEGDGSGRGFTPDVTETQKLTVLTGHYKAITDQVTEAGVAIGDLLEVGDGGVLVEHTKDSHDWKVVAVCTKASHTVNYRGTDYTGCIEYETL
jgi:hypothetical protein